MCDIQGLQMRYSKLTEEIRSAEAKLLRLRAELIEVEDQMQSASNGAVSWTLALLMYTCFHA